MRIYEKVLFSFLVRHAGRQNVGEERMRICMYFSYILRIMGPRKC